MPNTISIITPSHGQIDWLRLCVASVRDQVEENTERLKSGNLKTENKNQDFRISEFQRLSVSVEHIIQDAGTPGIEEFAREIGAEFHRNGEIISNQQSPISNQQSPISNQQSPIRNKQSTINNPQSAIGKYTCTVFSERDRGMYDAINRGFERARGEVVAWLNCDEQYLPGALAFAADYFSRHVGVDMIFGDAIMLDEECRPYSYRRVVMPSMDYLRTVSPNLFSCAAFFRRRVVDAGVRLDTQWRIIGDAVWFHDLLEAGFSARTVRRAVSAFTLTGDNLSTMQEQSDDEWARWRAIQDKTPLLPRMALVAMHRMKKMLGGAYRARTLDVPVFMPNATTARTVHRGCKLGSSWSR